MATSIEKRLPQVPFDMPTAPFLYAGREASPPRTPPQAGKARRASKGAMTPKLHVPARETFLDDSTPVDDAKMCDTRWQAERDSHELRLQPRQAVRESLMDNMLLSLDRYETQASTVEPRSCVARSQTLDDVHLYGTIRDDDLFDLSSTYRLTKKRRPRGHTYSSSYSSGYDIPGDEYSIRSVANIPRSQPSNNGSTVLERIEDLHGSDKERGKKFDAQRALPPSPRPMATRGWSERGVRTRKNSTSSSFDAGYVQLYGTTRWAATIGHRSRRFDHPAGSPIVHNPPTGAFTGGLVSHAWPQPLPDDPYDAAPNPIIPAGPSRQHSPERPGSLYRTEKRRASQSQPPVRKETNRTSQSPYRRKGKADEMDSGSLRLRSPGLGNIQDFKGIPTLVGYDDASAPAPTVSFGRPSPSGPPESRGRTKERPGFFRRVFGSSKNNKSVNLTSNQQDQASTLLPAADISNRRKREQGGRTEDEEPSQAAGALSTNRSEKALPTAPEQPAPLSKKPSSFFRRRRKSVSEEHAVPPIPPPPEATNDAANSPQQPPSPVSSLRKVMDPYIQSSLAGPGTFYDSEEQLEAHEAVSSEPGKAVPPDLTADKTENKNTRGTKKSATVNSGDGKEGRSKSSSTTCKCPIRRRFASSAAQSPNGKADPGRDSKATKETEQDRIPTIPSSKKLGSKKEVDELLPGPANPPSQNSLISPMREAVETSASNASTSKPSQIENCLPKNSESGRPARHASDQNIATSTTRDTAEGVSMGNKSSKSSRVWLKPTASEENLAETAPNDNSSANPLSSVKVPPSTETGETTPSTSPGFKTEGGGEKEEACDGSHLPSIDGVDQLTQEDYQQAKKLYEGSEDHVDTQTVAAWLGEPEPVRARVRKAYLELFDWNNVSILTAMRELCNKLVLRGETQQVDRILDAVSTRWCECNPNHGFKATDVVHTICYSILLLNTDLHVANIEQKMTKNQFIKNALPTIRRVVEDAAPGAFEPANASTLSRSRTSVIEPGTPSYKLAPDGGTWELDESRPSLDTERRSRRRSYRPSQWEDSRGRSPTPVGADSIGDEITLLVKAPFQGTKKAWEAQIETVLKGFYHSIRQQRLPLRGAPVEPVVEQSIALNPLYLLTGNVLKRTPSTLSKAQSENYTPRGRSELQRLGSTGRWASKNRSRPRIYPTSSAVCSSRTSSEDQSSSVWTPNSSTWSKNSLYKTPTTMTLASSGSYFSSGDYQQSIGFANALSQAIIRDDAATSHSTDDRIASLLEDETLGLAGAPWAKEGIVQYKHHLDSVDKRAKDRNWNECFAVIEKGWMRLFSFSTKGSTIRQRNKMHRQAVGSIVVGGGNWTENAEGIGSFLLRQTIASALPPPGYSKSRPYVWALSLPTGAVHLFQVGTPEIVKEFVSTANYWSARLSKEPLVGGISNVEYGWSDAVISQVLTENIPPNSSHTRPPSSSGGGHGRRPSFQSSIRSSMDHHNGGRHKLPGDRLTISDWNPPSQSMVASPLSEVDQLQALTTYVQNIELELQHHNELRGPMLLAFSPRHSNSTKAMTNWERKSCYLLREIVKFRTYIDCLTAAREREKEIRLLDQKEKNNDDDDGVGVGGGVDDDNDTVAVAKKSQVHDHDGGGGVE